jgi:hypothetical protein|tara:strand:+ start:4214 stop:4366 length:153 start_codon:yes stop_codon:yes gene_type:complete
VEELTAEYGVFDLLERYERRAKLTGAQRLGAHRDVKLCVGTATFCDDHGA